MALERFKRIKIGKVKIEKILSELNHSFVVHYSCESFYDREDGKSPRITSIAVRNLGSGQTESFSIHQIAEREDVDLSDIINHYDRLEKRMLAEFFNFALRHEQSNWLHWKMRDINYGFPALEHRAKVLGINEPYHINDDKRMGMARLMVDLYSDNYIEHPRLEKLILLNDITNRDFLSGEKEAEAFEKNEYVKLHQSTLRKVGAIANIFDRVAESRIVTKANRRQIYGGLYPLIINFLQTHWIISLVGFVSALIGIFVAIF